MIFLSFQSVPPAYPIHVVMDGLAEVVSNATATSTAEWILNIATLVIAIGGLILSGYVFFQERKFSEVQNDSNRRLELLKTLILDHNMEPFYEIFSKLTSSTDRLKDESDTENHREEVESEVQNLLRNLNEQVLMLFHAIDQVLYDNLLSESDKCRDILVENIGDETLQFNLPDQYLENILSHINRAKHRMIKIIFDYK